MLGLKSDVSAAVGVLQQCHQKVVLALEQLLAL